METIKINTTIGFESWADNIAELLLTNDGKMCFTFEPELSGEEQSRLLSLLADRFDAFYENSLVFNGESELHAEVKPVEIATLDDGGVIRVIDSALSAGKRKFSFSSPLPEDKKQELLSYLSAQWWYLYEFCFVGNVLHTQKKHGI
ncbi:hypothetical protein GYA13_01060 [Candidatus Kuenenbacteria bacterium]|nr:hypothetical protein [Candidatus Kuenenbacteria bacterium]